MQSGARSIAELSLASWRDAGFLVLPQSRAGFPLAFFSRFKKRTWRAFEPPPRRMYHPVRKCNDRLDININNQTLLTLRDILVVFFFASESDIRKPKALALPAQPKGRRGWATLLSEASL